MTSDKPPKLKRRRPIAFWIAVAIGTWGVLYPLSFGPACWLDSSRKPGAKAATACKALNTFYYPIIDLVRGLDNDIGDLILGYAKLHAADGRQAEVAVLGPPGSRTGKTWLVWFRRDLRPGVWLNATPTPDFEDRESVDAPAPNSGQKPQSASN